MHMYRLNIRHTHIVKKLLVNMHESWLNIGEGWNNYWSIPINMLAYASLIELLVLELIPSLKNWFGGSTLLLITMLIFVSLCYVFGKGSREAKLRAAKQASSQKH